MGMCVQVTNQVCQCVLHITDILPKCAAKLITLGFALSNQLALYLLQCTWAGYNYRIAGNFSGTKFSWKAPKNLKNAGLPCRMRSHLCLIRGFYFCGS